MKSIKSTYFSMNSIKNAYCPDGCNCHVKYIYNEILFHIKANVDKYRSTLDSNILANIYCKIYRNFMERHVNTKDCSNVSIIFPVMFYLFTEEIPLSPSLFFMFNSKDLEAKTDNNCTILHLLLLTLESNSNAESLLFGTETDKNVLNIFKSLCTKDTITAQLLSTGENPLMIFLKDPRLKESYIPKHLLNILDLLICPESVKQKDLKGKSATVRYLENSLNVNKDVLLRLISCLERY